MTVTNALQVVQRAGFAGMVPGAGGDRRLDGRHAAPAQGPRRWVSPAQVAALGAVLEPGDILLVAARGVPLQHRDPGVLAARRPLRRDARGAPSRLRRPRGRRLGPGPRPGGRRLRGAPRPDPSGRPRAGRRARRRRAPPGARGDQRGGRVHDARARGRRRPRGGAPPAAPGRREGRRDPPRLRLRRPPLRLQLRLPDGRRARLLRAGLQGLRARPGPPGPPPPARRGPRPPGPAAERDRAALRRRARDAGGAARARAVPRWGRGDGRGGGGRRGGVPAELAAAEVADRGAEQTWQGDLETHGRPRRRIHDCGPAGGESCMVAWSLDAVEDSCARRPSSRRRGRPLVKAAVASQSCAAPALVAVKDPTSAWTSMACRPSDRPVRSGTSVARGSTVTSCSCERTTGLPHTVARSGTRGPIDRSPQARSDPNRAGY